MVVIGRLLMFQGGDTAFIDKASMSIDRVTSDTADFSGFGDIAQLFRQLQYVQFLLYFHIDHRMLGWLSELGHG